MKTKIENDIEYILKNNIWYPNLKMKEADITLGKYGQMRLHYLKQHKNALYQGLVLESEIYSYCKEVERQAKVIFDLEYNRAKNIGYNNVEAELYAKEIVLKYVVFD